ncbi:LysR family transcriptional regulator [Kiloniella majae]|uniref:LysR family transcriptional regulator n=1 Tax=Kiloniella majae TaxID=1938558 RepID=UPI000A278DBE|nr:LysR family transcriptional regulator [Kiloniella majae]
MTLDQLRALCSVVDHGGFRAASEALHKSQSAISIAIRNLEEELRVEIFERDGYRPTLTDHGKVLVQKARTVLSQAKGLSDLAQHYAQGIEAELRIVVSEVFDIQHVLDALRIIRDQYPATRLTLFVENFNAPLEILEDKEADIALVAGGELFDKIEMTRYEKLCPVSLIPVVSGCSDQTKNAAELTVEDMDGTTQIVVADRSRNRDERKYGVLETSVPWRVNDFLTKKQIILSGLGWGRVPRHMIGDELASGDLIALSSPDFGPVEIEAYISRSQGHPFGPVAEAFWDLVVQNNRRVDGD